MKPIVILGAAGAVPDPDTIRRTAEVVLQRPEYHLDSSPESQAAFLVLLLRLVHWLATPFRWLFEALEGLPDPLRWLIVVGLGIVLLALLAHIGYTLIWAIRGGRRTTSGEFQEPGEVRDPKKLETQALEAADRGDYIIAVRLLFRACLMRLEHVEHRAFRAGATNREVLRRHRDSPLFEPMKLFVDVIETKWYGPGTCGPEDYEACRAAHLDILSLAKDRAHAHRA